MMRSNIQRIKLFVFFLIFLLVQDIKCDGSFSVIKDTTEDTPDATLTKKNVDQTFKKASAHNPPTQKGEEQNAVSLSDTKIISNGNKTLEGITSQSSGNANKTAVSIGPQKEQHFGEIHGTSLNPGALLRGLYVFAGLSVLIMAYIVFRSIRLSKTRAQMVRKYGVLAHRQDVEMRPLPLEEEDDEDTTVFDASNVLTNNVQHQNL